MDMKTRIIILIMSILCILNTQAELQYFLPTSNAYISINNVKFWFEGDTIIDNKRYTKVYQQYCYSETECEDNFYYYAAVREDTIGMKIYGLFPCADSPYTNCSEKLLADFDVEVGDRIMVYSQWFTSQLPAIVESVDFVEINGEYRKRINIKDEYQFFPDSPRDIWIEGIGSVIYGLFFPNPEVVIDAEDPPAFLCLHIDDFLIYQNPFYNTCYFKLEGYCDGYWCCVSDCTALGGTQNNCELYCAPPINDKIIAFGRCVRNCRNEGEEFGDCLIHCREEYDNTSIFEKLYNAFNISLSPTNEYLLVETEFASCSYVIYNVLGSVVKRGDLSNSQINISMFSPGIYYVVFYHKNNLIYTSKFIKR